MAHIEYHPENGCSPWVVVLGAAELKVDVANVWLAFRSLEEAGDHLIGLSPSPPAPQK